MNRKRGLLVYCWKLCRWNGIDINGKGIADMVESLSGKRMSKGFSYLWLEQSRALGVQPPPLPEVRPLIPPQLKPAAPKEKRKLTESDIKSRTFYETREWRELRYKALKDHGACCQACGRNWKDDKVKIHVDHIKPKSRFPELALEITNLQVLCEDCNLGKSNRDATDWR